MHRIPVLDGLRATSILLVLSAHMLPLGPKSWHLNEAAGAMGMSLFFALSGFLITQTLLRGTSVSTFAIHRLARIMPAAYLYIAFIAIVFGVGSEKVLANLLFLVNYWHSDMMPYSGHLWSLCVEMHFYAAIAMAVLLLGRRAVWLVWPACIFITALRVQDGAYINIMTHLRVDEILAGACVATIYNKWNVGRWATVVLAISAMLWFICSTPLAGTAQYLRPIATAMVLIGGLTLPAGIILSVMISRPMRYIATISYALYIWHGVTMAGWLGASEGWEKYLVKRPLSFALTFLAAHLSTFYWERRWINLARSAIPGTVPA